MFGLSVRKHHRIFKPKNFAAFTYSRKCHMRLFRRMRYDVELFGKPLEKSELPLKIYQDLLVFAFIKNNIPPGAKILDVGGGHSRIIHRLKATYECWNIDKLEGCGHGPQEINTRGFHLVKDYMGNFNTRLPNDYFDMVFSISALEHVPQTDPDLFRRILADINRVLKPGGYSLHCMDSIIRSPKVWANALLYYFFDHVDSYNPFRPFEKIETDRDLLIVPKSVYDQNWLKFTKTPYDAYGKPISYNILWDKPG